MRSRNDAVEPQATIDRALRHGLCGFGQLVARPGERERLARRVARFAEVDEGSFVWTRAADGMFWLGRICGPYAYDDAGASVDLVHVRPSAWLSVPILEQEVPPAVVATFGRGGRNFQAIRHASIGDETQRIWDKRTNQAAD